MKKILSIDGGGIKGIFAASFLANIEKTCGIRICDYFDLIIGTSTGAIIAAALALEIPAERILELYLEKGKVIFPQKRKIPLFGGRYQTAPLKSELEKIFAEKKLKDSKTRLMIPSYNLETRKVTIFKTSHAEDLYIDKEKKIVDCLLASTAAPTFFNPYKMEDGVFMDGGVGANNPSILALVEGISRCNWELEEIVLLSIGGVNEPGVTTGKEKMGIIDALKIQKCFMNAESQYSDNMCKILLPRNNYLRINQDALKNQVGLDLVKCESMSALKTWGGQMAKERINEVKNTFLCEQKEKVEFYNL